MTPALIVIVFAALAVVVSLCILVQAQGLLRERRELERRAEHAEAEAWRKVFRHAEVREREAPNRIARDTWADVAAWAAKRWDEIERRHAGEDGWDHVIPTRQPEKPPPAEPVEGPLHRKYREPPAERPPTRPGSLRDAGYRPGGRWGR